MNREIKFRIWDKQNKKWLENSSSLHCNSNWTICPFTGNVVDYVETCDENGENFSASPANDYYWEDGKLIKEPRYITQQYTGLKDKNGKEIYEGDLIRYEKEYTPLDKYSIIAPVVFSPFGYGFVIDSSGRHSIGDSKYGDYIPLLSPIVMEKKVTYEVVGNIFENKNDE